MVNSRLNHDINYVERRDIEDEDLGYSSSIYEIDVDDGDGGEITLSIVIGRPKLTYVSKNILYFPIYVVSSEDKIKGQIGVFEINAAAKDITRYTNPDLEIDEEKLGEPLLYSFSTPKFLKKAAAAAAQPPQQASEVEKHAEKEKEAAPEKEKEAAPEKEEKAEEAPEEDEDDLFDLEPKGEPADLGDDETYKIPKMAEIFTRTQQQRKTPELHEETAADKNKYKKEYHETKNTQWVEKFFQNNHFRIAENQGGGDCFFYVVRDAFAQLGYMTTIAKLRAIVSENVTTAQFDFYQTMYTSTKTNLLEIEATIKKHAEINKDLRKKTKTVKNKEEEDTIVKSAKENLEAIKKLEAEKKEAADLHRDFEFMANIDTLEKLRRYVKEPAYWADVFAITILEKHLRVKMIILSEAEFERGALDFVLQCGEQIEGAYSPFFYIITTYSGDHYRLVTYKERKILKYREIPYAIKVLIMSKCMERMAGPYNQIHEFKQLKEHYGIEDVSREQQEEEDELNASMVAVSANLYDRGDVEFMFHAKSAHARIGKGIGEVVPTEKIPLYRELDTIKDWRRAFDDTYEDAEFELHGKRWKSVEIYYQAAKFRKQNTPFYELFSLDSGNEIGKNLEMAKIAGSIDGKGTIKNKAGEKKTVVLRDKAKIKIDADFYNGVRNHDERRAAIREKFKQHPELRRALVLTKRALLKQFRPRREPEIDVELMEVREELSEDGMAAVE